MNTNPPPLLQESQVAADVEAEAEQLAKELPLKHQPLANKTRYATSMAVQSRVLMRRFMLVYWRSPSYNVCCAIQTCVIFPFHLACHAGTT